MTGRYLTELDAVLLDAGLTVVAYGDWQSRARSSGGYGDGRPWCVMFHHTASTADIENDAAYCATGSPDAPICNALIARDGTVWLIAAGATNTNGKGGPWPVSRGTVPADQMNTHAVGLEICNAGTGEQYPAAQLDAVMAASLAICDAYGLAPWDAAEHAEWAPDRKIDPATAAAVQGGWRPRSVNSSGTWSGDDLRGELTRRADAPLPDRSPPPGHKAPPPTQEDQSMVVALDSNGTAWIGDGMTRQPITSESVFNNYVVLGKAGAYRFVNTNGETVDGWHNVHEIGADTLEALGRA